jgi:ubiquinone/menaquinone biosynthesis C-methylase UbiE
LIIKEIKEHWNKIITGDEQTEYADYVVKKYLNEASSLTLLSLGCGAGSHEIKFAKYNNFLEIKGIDLAPKLIDEANKNAQQNGFTNLKYEAGNVYEINLPNAYFDIVLFHSSLHHFNHLDFFIGNKIKNTLKKNGLLIIHEYVGPNRIQWTKEQLTKADEILNTLDSRYIKRFRLNNSKTKNYRPGKLRMIISDPSEAVESTNILPTIHTHFKTIEEHHLGGNIIMPLFKDIAHNFIDGSIETKKILHTIFETENKFIQTHPSDFVFGIYQKVD